MRHQSEYSVEAADRATQVASPAFDASVWEIWPYLSAGASLQIAGEETRRLPGELLNWLERERITLSFLPTPLAEGVLEQVPASMPGLKLRALLTGGDKLHAVSRQVPFQLLNHYGPTENAVVATWTAVDCQSKEMPPIGKPIANVQMYVLDKGMRAVPAGVSGELYLGGSSMARGYLNRAGLTAERFVPDPFGAEGGRVYRTGDLGQWLEDGNIEYLGRNDFQVKIRGFRIELGEIEGRLAEHEGVREAVVIAREDTPGEKRLVAYYTGREGEIGPEELRTHLSGRLPEYMVPAAFVKLERMPLTPNGKVDRKALPAPEGDAYAVQGYEAPQTETEEVLAKIFADVLKLERVGRHDNFFALGGHSLLVLMLIERMRRIGLQADARTIFQQPGR